MVDSKNKGAGTPPQLPVPVDCNITLIKDANPFPAEFKVNIRERLATDKDLMHLVTSIKDKLMSVHHGLGVRPDDNLLAMLNMNTIVSVWDNTFCTGANGIFMVLNANGDLVGIKPDKMHQFIRSEYGYDLITVPTKDTRYAELTYKQLKLFVTSATDEFVGVITARRQRTALNQRVDMFIEKSTISMQQSYADVVFHYKPLTAGNVDQIVIDMVMADFTEHFTLFDYFIEAVIAARFAPDRRNAFMWLQACSGWGKGLLIAAFAELGLVIEMSVKEVEAAFEGKAVGASPTDFIHAWLLVIDEFKTIKSEVKQLNNTIMLSPKFQLKGKAPVYFKLFTSAEDVPSLTGSEGVESQFAKRFTYFKPATGDLDDRALFTQLGSGVYRKALSAGIAAVINTKVAEYRAMGIDKAQKVASDLLFQFNCEHSIANHFDSIESTVEDHAADLKELLLAFAEWIGNGEIGIPSKLITTLPDTLQRKFRNSIELGVIGELDVVFLNRPIDAVKAWLNDRVDRGQIAKISHKTSDITCLVNEVGSVTKTKLFHKMTKVTKVTPDENVARKKGIAVILRVKPTFSVSFL